MREEFEKLFAARDKLIKYCKAKRCLCCAFSRDGETCTINHPDTWEVWEAKTEKENIADEMFKELGFEIDTDETYGLIRYNKDDESYIRFKLEDKCIDANNVFENEIFILSLDMNLLKAINQKCRELGWLDD